MRTVILIMKTTLAMAAVIWPLPLLVLLHYLGIIHLPGFTSYDPPWTIVVGYGLLALMVWILVSSMFILMFMLIKQMETNK